MKKLLYVFLAALLVMSLAGCGSKQSNVQPDNGQQDAAQTTAKFARGSWDDSKTTFTNGFSGITIKISSDYLALTDAELAENYLGDTSFDFSAADYDKMTTIPECAFANNLTGSNCGVLYENVAAEGAPDISEDDYLDAAVKNIDGIKGGYYDLTIGGKQHRAMNRSIEQNGNTFYQTMAVRNINGYMLLIVFTSTEQEPIDEMRSFFE